MTDVLEALARRKAARLDRPNHPSQRLAWATPKLDQLRREIATAPVPF